MTTASSAERAGSSPNFPVPVTFTELTNPVILRAYATSVYALKSASDRGLGGLEIYEDKLYMGVVEAWFRNRRNYNLHLGEAIEHADRIPVGEGKLMPIAPDSSLVGPPVSPLLRGLDQLIGYYDSKENLTEIEKKILPNHRTNRLILGLANMPTPLRSDHQDWTRLRAAAAYEFYLHRTPEKKKQGTFDQDQLAAERRLESSVLVLHETPPRS